MTAIPPKGTNHTPIKCLLTIFVNGFTRGTTRYASPRYRKWLFRLPLSFLPSTSFFSAPFYSPGSVVIFRGRATITCSHYHRLFIGLSCYVDDRISPFDLTRLFLFFTIVRRLPFPRLLTEFHRGTMRYRDVCDDWLHQKGLRDIITVYPESENQDWKRKVKSEKRKVGARGARRYMYWEATLTTTSHGNENEGNRRHVCVRISYLAIRENSPSYPRLATPWNKAAATTATWQLANIKLQSRGTRKNGTGRGGRRETSVIFQGTRFTHQNFSTCNVNN